MSATPQQQVSTAGRLELIHTQLGFDLVADPGDYVSTLLIRDGVYEAPETDLVTRIVRAGDICVDAGCHVGYYSCLLAKLVGDKGRVFAIDPNPQACQAAQRNLRLNGSDSAEVIQAALADQDGNLSFHVSTDDQTGLSSLGPIPMSKETISVPCIRLDGFLDQRRVSKIRLLKLDVEGAEEIALRGLGRYLSSHAVDFILVECYDERLRLLNTSTKAVAAILKSAGYTCWEFATANPAGWSRTTDVRSRGDCNYLFSSPSITDGVAGVSLATALDWTRSQRDQLLSEKDRLQAELQDRQDKLQDDIDWLLSSVRVLEEKEAKAAQMAAEKKALEAIWSQVQSSASWRILNKWRKVRDRLAPDDSLRRRSYDFLLRRFRGE